MLRGYLVAAIALIVWLVLSAGNLPGNPDHSSRGHRRTASSPTTLPALAPGLATGPGADFTAYPGYNPDPCYHAKTHDAADLCAQWRAALAAEDAAREAHRATDLAQIGAILSAAAIVGLIVTIRQTNGALSEARRGNRLNLLFEKRSRREDRERAKDQVRAFALAERNADTATRQAEIAEETARQRLRAYVGAQALNYTYNRETGQFAVAAEIKNFGSSPAFRFRMVASLNYVPFPIGDPPDVGLPEGYTHTLYPTMMMYANTRLPADPIRIDDLRRGQGCYLFTLVMEYFDHQAIRHVETIRSYKANDLLVDPFAATHTATMTYWSGDSA